MPIYMTARWKCRPGAEETVAEALREFVAAVRQNEPRTRLYTALQEDGQANSFMTYFIFEDETAEEFHRSTPWVQRFTGIIYPENLEPVVFTRYQLLASTGQ